jgi:hypothetical protein
MRPPQLLLIVSAIVLAAATPATARTPLQGARQAFDAELRRQCPAQRLQDMTAGDLEGLIEGFETRFTPGQTRQLQDAIGYRCARIEAGLTCGDNASLEVFRRQGALKAFTREACASGWSCRAFADCTQTRP